MAIPPPTDMKPHVVSRACRNGAHVWLRRAAINASLPATLRGRGQRGNLPRSHGNYLPALDAAVELLKGDAKDQRRLFLIFLSDGAPSDHVARMCSHGVCVWQDTGDGRVNPKTGKFTLQTCPVGRHNCRMSVRSQIPQGEQMSVRCPNSGTCWCMRLHRGHPHFRCYTSLPSN